MKTQLQHFSGILFFVLLSNISMSQNVGIGTSVPAEKLHVVGTIRSTALAGVGNREVLADANGTLTIGTVATAPDWTILGNSNIVNGTNFIGTTNNVDFRIRTNNIERVSIRGTGQVGILTNNPLYQFHMLSATTAASTSMATYENTSVNGVALFAYNNTTTSGYNAFEGVTNYGQTTFIAAGVFGLALNNTASSTAYGVRGHTNSIDGVGVRGTRVNVGGFIGWGGVFYNDLGYTGFFGLASDERLKSDIKPLTNSLKVLHQLTPYSFKYDIDKYPYAGFSNDQQFGFIAQDVEKVIPQIVKEKMLDVDACKVVEINQPTLANNQKFKMIDQQQLIPLLVAAIKEQQQMIDKLNERIAALEKMNSNNK